MRISLDAKYLIGGSALLFAALVLEVARENMSFLIWHDFWVTFLVVVGTQSLLITILALIFPNRLSLAAMTTLAIWLSAYHHDLIGQAGVPAGVSATFLFSLLSPMLLVVLLSLLIAVALMSRHLVARVIGAVGLALFGLAVIQFAQAYDLARVLKPALDPMSAIDRSPLPEPAQATARLPDIIYIVPDRYANSGVLASVFQHDNSGFLDELRRRGFDVAEKARANYLKTPFSLSSVMNLQYVERFSLSLNGVTKKAQPMYTLIQDNFATARLKQMGYRYVHLPSWWDGTRQSVLADHTVDFLGDSLGGEFGRAVLQRSPVVKFGMSIFRSIDHCKALKQQLAYLETVGGDDRPTFAFAHVLAPHNPILVDAEGHCIEQMDYPMVPLDGTWDAYKAGYSGFVTYLNRRFLEIFDRQKASNPNPLIFVIQADEGPYPKAYREDQAARRYNYMGGAVPIFDWREATDAQLAMKFGILNALYLSDPAGDDGRRIVPDTMSPVNNWRVIFSKLEGKNYPLLPDRYFIFPTDEDPYNSIEITERLDAVPR